MKKPSKEKYAVSLKKLKNPFNISLFLLGIILISATLYFVGTSDVLAVIKQVSLPFILLLVGLKFTEYLIWSFKWKLLIDEISKTKYLRVIPIFFAGLLGNNITPGPFIGGEPVKAYFLAKECKTKTVSCFVTTIVDTGAQLLVFLVFITFSMVYAMLYVPVFWIVILLKLFSTLLIFSFIIFYIFRIFPEITEVKEEKFFRRVYNFKYLGIVRRKFSHYEEFKSYILTQIGIFKHTLSRLLENKRRLLKSMSLSFVVYLMTIFEFYLIFYILGTPVSFIQILVVVTISGILGYLAFLPGGTGVVEASSIAMLTVLGISTEIAAAATLINRAIFYVITYGFGYVMLLTLNRRYSAK